MIRTLQCALTTLALACAPMAASCGGQPAGEDAAAVDTSRAKKAADLANKIKAAPDDAEAILKEAGLTPEQFQKELREIAADPDQAEAYADALKE